MFFQRGTQVVGRKRLAQFLFDQFDFAFETFELEFVNIILNGNIDVGILNADFQREVGQYAAQAVIVALIDEVRGFNGLFLRSVAGNQVGDLPVSTICEVVGRYLIEYAIRIFGMLHQKGEQFALGTGPRVIRFGFWLSILLSCRAALRLGNANEDFFIYPDFFGDVFDEKLFARACL